MSENVKPKTRWKPPKLERHEDFIVQQRQSGASIRDVQRALRTRKVRVSISTISRYLKTVPGARWRRLDAASDEAPTKRPHIRSQADSADTAVRGSRKENFRKRNAADQARYWVSKGLAIGKPRHKNHSDGKIHSLGTKRNYEGCLTRFCRWIQTNKLCDLESVRIIDAMQYLHQRSTQVGQKTLDLDRQSMQFLFRQTTGADIRLERVKSTYTGGRRLATEPRAYSAQELKNVCRSLSPRSALAARLCFWSGLRTHELATLRPASEMVASRHRDWSPERFGGRTGALYVVTGKGGLRREVMLPHNLAASLERRRLDRPKTVCDRGINYRQHYDITTGNSLTVVWTRASRKELGWSAGAHGLRHSYAQKRINELQQLGYGYEERKAIVAQELGHFRSDETETYLR